jgi:hypothetical protein
MPRGVGQEPFFSGEVEPCINGRTIAIGVYFGQNMDALVDRLLGEQLEDGGWNCEAENGSVRSSFATTINVLEGLLAHQRARSPASNFLAVLTKLENGRDVVWTVHPDGSEQRKVIEKDGLASPRWSAAGDAIYFLRTSQGHTQDLLKVAIDPESGQAKKPASALLSGLQAGDYFTVSMEGTRLGYSRSQN